MKNLKAFHENNSNSCPSKLLYNYCTVRERFQALKQKKMRILHITS